MSPLAQIIEDARVIGPIGDLPRRADFEQFLEAALNGVSLKRLFAYRVPIYLCAWLISRMERRGEICLSVRDNDVWVQAPGHSQRSGIVAPPNLIDIPALPKEVLCRIEAALTDSRRRYEPQHLQSQDTIDSALRRFAFAAAFGDHKGERALVLGDDAMFGLILALAGDFDEIVVADIDPDLLALVRTLCEEMAVHNLRTLEYDVRTPLARQILNTCDVFFASGWKDLQGLLLFLCRGISSLADPPWCRVGYFTYGSHKVLDQSALNEGIRFQEMLSRFGCLLNASAPCVEVELPTVLETVLCGIIAGAPDSPKYRDAFLQSFERLKEIKCDVIWFDHPDFPNISLAPLSIGRLIPVKGVTAEMTRYMTISEHRQNNR